jgi:hypothetical protein
MSFVRPPFGSILLVRPSIFGAAQREDPRGGGRGDEWSVFLARHPRLIVQKPLYHIWRSYLLASLRLAEHEPPGARIKVQFHLRLLTQYHSSRNARAPSLRAAVPRRPRFGLPIPVMELADSSLRAHSSSPAHASATDKGMHKDAALAASLVGDAILSAVGAAGVPFPSGLKGSPPIVQGDHAARWARCLSVVVSARFVSSPTCCARL